MKLTKKQRLTQVQMRKTPPETLIEIQGLLYDFSIKDAEGHVSLGDLMTKEAWLEGVEYSMFIDYDGYGDPCRFNREKGEWEFVGCRVAPSRWKHFPADATHILWYNR